MIRAIKLKLYSTKNKQNKIQNLIIQYRKAVNFYINILFTQGGKLDKVTLAKLNNTLLSERFKSNALKQAIEIYKSCMNKKVKTHTRIPKFRGFPILDAKFIEIQEGNNSFDLYIKTSIVKKNSKLYLPTKKTKVFNYWMNKGILIQGCELHKNKVIVWIKMNDNYKQEGNVIGIDLGMKKLMTTNEAQYLGKRFTELRHKIESKKKNSKNYKRAIKELHNYINQEIKNLDYSKLRAIGHENLTGITKGKTGFRKNKYFRKAQQHWSHRRIITRLIEKCQENRVRPVYINPKNTSRTCSQCGHVAKESRKGESFNCVKCGHTIDADLNAAINIFVKTCDYLRSVESLDAQKVIVD